MSFLGLGQPSWNDLIRMHKLYLSKYGSVYAIDKLDHKAKKMLQEILEAAVHLYGKRALSQKDEEYLERLILTIKEAGVTAK